MSDHPVDVLRGLYELATATLFPKRQTTRGYIEYEYPEGYKNENIMNPEKNPITRPKRQENIALFFSEFCKFYKDTYITLKPVCVSEMSAPANARVSYVLPEGEEYKPARMKTGDGGNLRGSDWIALTVGPLRSLEFPNSRVNSRPFNTVRGDNILIIGAGPVGSYLAGLVKLCAPHLEVNLLENRSSDTRLRKLERITTTNLESIIVQNDFFAVDQINDLLIKVCPVLESLLIQFNESTRKPYLNILNNIFHGESVKTITINYLEFLLGRFAQECGVIIYHDNKATSLEYIESQYVNEKTKYVFDGTGGRLLSNSNINARFPVVRKHLGRTLYNEHTRRRPENIEHVQRPNKGDYYWFSVREGYLTPDQAIFRRGPYIYAAIGDSFMKTDFTNSKAVAFGASMSIAVVLVILRELMDTTEGGMRRKRRHTRKKVRV